MKVSAIAAALCLSVVTLGFQPLQVNAQQTTSVTPSAPTMEQLKSTPLPVDPRLKIKKLDNGMTYWILPHQSPEDRIFIYLHVHSGSLNETEAQRGLAHYLEHMAFNGSENFPPGELIKSFESVGMMFGAHQNAFTGFDQTTYTLELPNTKAETLDLAMLCMADYAFRMLLLDEEIDKERGVIIEEKRFRAGVSERIWDQLFPIMYPNSLVSERMPIGILKVIENAKRQDFVDYYKKWYRPDNTTLIVVGDVKPDEIEASITKHFKDWKAEGDKTPNKTAGITAHTETKAAVITDPELPVAYLGYSRMFPKMPMKTAFDYREALLDGLGTAMFNRRLANMKREGKAPWQGANVSISDEFHVLRSAEISVSSTPDKAYQSFAELVKQVKGAREYGFLESEFEQVKATMIAGMQQAVKRESTLESGTMIRGLNNVVTAERKPMSAQQRLDLTQTVLQTVSLDEVEARFKSRFEVGPRMVTLIGPEQYEWDNADKLIEIMNKAEAAEVTPPKDRKKFATLLDQEPSPGTVLNKKHHETSNTTTVEYDNGVLLHVRPMDARKNVVWLQLTLPGGLIKEKTDNAGITSLALTAFSQTAAKSRPSTAIADLLSGKNVGITAGADDDMIIVTASMALDDVETGFQLTHLMMTQPQIEASAVDSWKKGMLQSIEAYATSVNDQTSDRVYLAMSNYDQRWAPMTQKQVNSLTQEAAQAWLEQILATAPIEAAIVGDITTEQALALADKYLGSLPKRDRAAGLKAIEPYRQVEVDPGPKMKTVEVSTVTNRSVVYLTWRGTDSKNDRERRLLAITARWLSKPLRDVIREERGLTYSTSMGYRSIDAYPEMSHVFATFTCDPEKADEALKIAEETLIKKIEEGPTEDEVNTLHKQFANIIEQTQKQPTYWLSILASMTYRDHTIDDVMGAQAFYTSVTAKDIHETAEKFMVPERMYKVMGKPLLNTEN